MTDTAFPRSVHIMAIGGAAMSAIAQVLVARGSRVTGCDVRTSPNTDRLALQRIPLVAGPAPELLAGADMVIASAAIRPDEPELVGARARGIETLTRAEAVGRLLTGYRTLAVAGTHGKTTTSALCAFMLTEAGFDPFFLIGGDVRNLDANARAGAGPWAVVEADEYADAFLGYRAHIAVLLNVEEDHLNYFGSLERIRASFRRYLAGVPADGAIIACADNAEVIALVADRGAEPAVAASVSTYGLEPGAEWGARDLAVNDLGGSSFTVTRSGRDYGHFETRLPGEHNVLNAVAAVAAGTAVGVPLATQQYALREFLGAGLRFELVGDARGVTLIEDYAHHPTEVAALLKAARGRYPVRRIVILFQPHTYSRTAYVFDKFTRCFETADACFIMATDGDRERPDEGRTSEDLVAHVTSPSPVFVTDFDDMAAKLGAFLRPDDVLLLVGAGNIKKAGPIMLAELQRGA